MTHNEEEENKIIKIIKEKKPSSGSQLVEYMVNDLSISREQALNILVELEDKEKILFTKTDLKRPTFINYIISENARWYQLTMLVSIIALILILSNTASSILLYLRYGVGTVFGLFIPGYCVTRILYAREKISIIKKILFSTATSISIIAIIGIVLNYSRWGINPIPVALMAFTFNVVLSSVELFIEYQNIIN